MALGFDLDDYAIRFDTLNIPSYMANRRDEWDAFSWEFFNKEGRNVATWIQATGICTIQPGMDGKGRVYGFARPTGTNDRFGSATRGAIVSKDGRSRTILDFIGGIIDLYGGLVNPA